MYLYINKKSKQIAMASDSKLKVDKNIFEEKQKNITEEEWQVIDNAKRSFYKNGKIITEKHPEQEQQEKQNKINNIKDKLQKNQMTEKEAILELLNN